MIENTILNFISIFSIGVAYFFWHVLWKSYLIDRTREDLFALRDKLFNLGLKQEGTTFGDPTYRSFELIINGTIRFTHRISLLRHFIFTSLIHLVMPDRKVMTTLGYELERGYGKLDSASKEKFKELLDEYERIVISHLVYKSLFILTLTFIAGLIYSAFKTQMIVAEGVKKVYNSFRGRVRSVYHGTIREIQYTALLEMRG